MMDSIATVTALEGGYAVFQVEKAGCGRCHEKGGCGGHHLAGFGKPRTLRLPNPGNISIGDQVRISIPDGSLWRLSLLAYGAPLFFLFSGVLLGGKWGGESAAILMVFPALLCSGLWLSWLSRRGKGGVQPVITDCSRLESSYQEEARAREKS